MGHEQLDTKTNFAGQSFVVDDSVDDQLDRHADGGGEAPGAPASSTWDRVFGSDPEVPPSGPPPVIGPPGLCKASDSSSRYSYPKLSREQLKPPHRPKFLHGVAADGTPIPKAPRQLSSEMQGHLDSLVVSTPPSGSQSARAAAPSAAPSAGGPRTEALRKAVTPRRDIGHGQALRVDAVAPSQQRFAWNSDRIAHELVCKFDQFTRRREDHMRKLLWTFGSDPAFESENKMAIRVAPNNFNRVCDRFGIVCNETQAQEIFKSHSLPPDGCNLYNLAKNFLDTNDGALSARKKGVSVAAAADESARLEDPFKLARIPDRAWRNHHQQQLTGAAGAPFAVSLPPITTASA